MAGCFLWLAFAIFSLYPQKGLEINGAKVADLYSDTWHINSDMWHIISSVQFYMSEFYMHLLWRLVVLHRIGMKFDRTLGFPGEGPTNCKEENKKKHKSRPQLQTPQEHFEGKLPTLSQMHTQQVRLVVLSIWIHKIIY